MFSWLIGDLWPYLATAGAALAAIAGAWLSGRKAGKNAVENKALKESAKRAEGGRDEVAKEQAKTDGLSVGDIVDRMRRRGRD